MAATDMIKVFSNKSFRFDHPADKNESVSVKPGFDVIPEWAKESTMYKLAESDGDVMEIKSREDEVAAEKGGARKKPANASSATV